MERLGTRYGGWFVPTRMNLNKDSVVYSGGVGEDISFDLLLQNKYNCEMILIDPTEKAIRHFDDVKRFYSSGERFATNIQPDYYACISNLSPDLGKFKYVNLGLWDKSDVLKFYKQTNESYVSQSLVEDMFGKQYNTVRVDSIKNLMEQQGHAHIDLLKVDIEGAEVRVLNQMIDDQIYPSYLLVEFDLLLKKKDTENATRKLVQRLVNQANYRLVQDDNLNMTFERVK